MLPCIVAVAIATFVAAKSFQTNGWEWQFAVGKCGGVESRRNLLQSKGKKLELMHNSWRCKGKKLSYWVEVFWLQMQMATSHLMAKLYVLERGMCIANLLNVLDLYQILKIKITSVYYNLRAMKYTLNLGIKMFFINSWNVASWLFPYRYAPYGSATRWYSVADINS